MKLYVIDQNLQFLLDRLDVDPETGEITSDERRAELLFEIHALIAKRQDILEYLAKQVLNLRAETEMLQQEENRLSTRRKACERQESRLISILDRECGGEKTNLGVATLTYRSAPHVEVTDESAAVSWLMAQGFDNALKFAPPTIYKSEVQRLIKLGRTIPGCKMVTESRASLK